MPRTIADRVRERLDALGKKARPASVEAGLGPDFIRNLLRNPTQVPKGDNLFRLADVLEVDANWLLTEHKAALSGGEPRSDTLRPTPRLMERVTLSEIDITMGVGGGGLPAEAFVVTKGDETYETDFVKAYWDMPEAFIRGELRVSPHSVRLAEVRGDSMEPTLRSGDRVMVDVGHTVPSPPGVYALWDGIGVIVKRIELVSPPGAEVAVIKVASDNPRHETRERTLEEVSIIGRVVCKISAL